MWPFSSSKSAPVTPNSIEPVESVQPPEPLPAGSRVTITIPEGYSTAVREAEELEKSPLPPSPITGYSNERLSIPPIIRGPILVAMAFATGLSLGATIGGRLAADRYRAENAHRFPTTKAGWYLYHRTKSYHTALGGANRGVKSGLVLGAWALGFMATEEGVDQMRARLLKREGEESRLGQRDFLSTVVAAIATAGVYSRVKRMDKFATVKTSRMALKGGLVFGLCQDVVACLRKEPPGYISWTWEKVRGRRKAEIVV